jgi:glycerol-3-phosphate dehydrogenase
MDYTIRRDEQINRMRRGGKFDLAVIGGGINGAAIARDAAMRGLSVALIDKGDFAGATSSRSSKLIHGGLRYLPQGQLKLVYQALRERERLRRVTAPHLVRPVQFLMPLYRGRGFGPFTLSMGLTLYDWLAWLPRAECHRTLDTEAVLGLVPSLSHERLCGGALYCDGWSDDARLTMENVLDAAYHGTAVANYVRLENLTKASGRLRTAAVRDLAGGTEFEIRADHFVNAAGPWVDDIRAMDDRTTAPSIRLTKGVHLVIPAERIPIKQWLVLSDDHGRIVFVMPQDRYVVVGTTDTDFNRDRDNVSADRDDVAYLLAVLRENLCELKLNENDVVSSYAGLRALLRTAPGSAPSSVSREETIIESKAGLFSVAGGKLTTHREIAQKVVDRLMREMGRRSSGCPTLKVPLPGARALALASGSSGNVLAMTDAVRASLNGRYGARAALVANLVERSPELGEPLADKCPVLRAEVIFAARFEMALTLQDFVVRRTSLIWRYPLEAEVAAPEAARLMAAELGWDAARQKAELEGMVSDLRIRRAA